MDGKKNIVDLDTFRDMLHISPRVPGQSFDELLFEEEILDFLWFLGHSAQINTLADVSVNKLFQPWRSFAAGLYHKRNIYYAFLIWKDFVYQVEHKNQKKSNEMYNPRFTKVIIHHFMTKKPSILRCNKQYGALLPIELTNEDIRNTKAYKEYYAYASGEAVPKPKASAKRKRDIRNTKAYKEYYACATGEAAPKLKVSARRKRGGSVSSTTPPTPIATPTPITTIMAAPRRRHEMHISQQGGSSTDEGTSSRPGVLDVPSDDSEE
nr:hypothetical protein [Tanacetum cinerariifolium]